MLNSEIATLPWVGDVAADRQRLFVGRACARDLPLHLQRDGGVVAGPRQAAAVADLAMDAGRFVVVRDRAGEVAEVEQDVADVVQRDRQVDAIANLAADRQRLAVERQRALESPARRSWMARLFSSRATMC